MDQDPRIDSVTAHLLANAQKEKDFEAYKVVQAARNEEYKKKEEQEERER